jgi:hypothetical protein
MKLLLCSTLLLLSSCGSEPVKAAPEAIIHQLEGPGMSPAPRLYKTTYGGYDYLILCEVTCVELK